MVYLRNVFPIIIAAAVTVIGLPSCGGSSESLKNATTEERFNRGMEALENEDYEDALKLFEVILLQDPASKYADDAQYYLGETHYRMKDYRVAAFHFSRVMNDFPSSKHYRKALFKTGECYFLISPQYERDQRQTQTAIRQYEAFVKYFPNDSLAAVSQDRIRALTNKLAHRDYYVASSYLDHGEYEAARIYLERIIDRYPESDYYPDAVRDLERVKAEIQED
jgi:outer membrane protein assembly factor BamD